MTNIFKEFRRERLKEKLPDAWKPIDASPQLLAYNSPADQLLYGGAAGGGKTELLIGLATTKHLNTLILRREYRQLNKIIARLEQQTGKHFNRQTQLIHYGRRIIELGGCQHERNKQRYKGRDQDLYCFDELSEFTQSIFEYIIAWNRSTDPDQRCRVVATSNPPDTPTGQWIIKYWAPWLDPKHPNPADSGELRFFFGGEEVESDDPIEYQGKFYRPLSRTFIAASIEDNPFLMATGYDRLLANLPPELRIKLKAGDFSSAVIDSPYQVIPTSWVQAAQDRYTITPRGRLASIGVDPARGGGDRTVIALRYQHRIELVIIPGEETQTADPIIAELVKLTANRGRVPINVDAIGIGASVVDLGRKANLNIKAIDVRNKSTGRDRQKEFYFKNIRSEILWKVREHLDLNYGAAISLPDDSDLLREFTAPQYYVGLNGIQVEPKDKIRARLGYSTDILDAIALCLILPQTIKAQSQIVTNPTLPSF